MAASSAAFQPLLVRPTNSLVAPRATPDISSVSLKASSAASAGDEKPKTNLALLAVYFIAWYALNVGYNITNKQVLNVFPCYATVAAAQLIVAWFWLLPQWAIGIRPVPKPSESNMKALQKVSLLHGFGHLVTVLSMGLGAVSFVHVVKAAEPVFAAVLSAIFAGSIMAFPVYLSLLPVCAGVAIASAGELSFTWACFGAAMMSNLLFASRAVFSKMAMSGKDQGENMDSANTFAVVTMLATLICVPVAAVLEGPKIMGAWNAALAVPGMTQFKLASTLALSGWYLYTYNEFAFKVLGLVSPVAQAVGNTVKRVVILIATAIAFGTPMTPIGITGSAIAMAGVLVYSLVQQAYAKK
ncbi:hypothetical protein GUITHDRAFT_158072 [Guillardia theta CCMP2712]|uniref:Sugar phosphate transporter domain-containing protein n=1 Tax=Guillardia theta (strain CCMP2712) TaxID=905079 RepID=L1J531_GUITC|nr:hypothetical protein GUITHDRAFT_158072 [Guillardia theta CCMP2712]EKX43195.1 hypothetical protein GUITHDRAFT_158072 [Guillardia theta CCMP2712]|eukprot:XP_005830175.1 hypothetical protein GUITHDRAFT_158072 [Guillardia theta CCMP2712]